MVAVFMGNNAVSGVRIADGVGETSLSDALRMLMKGILGLMLFRADAKAVGDRFEPGLSR
jgi:hypothetical protein